MQLRIQNMRVRSLDISEKEVTWELATGIAEPLDYTFQVERSESPGGPWEAVSPAFQDRYVFVDRRIPSGDKFLVLYYRLRVTHIESKETEWSELAAQLPEASQIAQYIRRMQLTYFTQVAGRAVWLFKRRTFGPKCRTCWDRTIQKRTVDRCLDCFSAGMLRGYHNPIEVFMQIDPTQKALQAQPQQIAQFVATSARLSYYPNVSPGDLIVEAENKRWRVQSVAVTEHLRAPVKQELSLRQLEEKDIEFQIPIHLDKALRDVQPSPVHMFDMAADIQSVIDHRDPNLFDGFMAERDDG